MGRSVSYPSNTIALAFTQASANYYCKTCVDEDEGESYCDYSECKRCKKAGRNARIEPDYHLDQMDLEDFVENLTDGLKKALPSLSDHDEWIDREDHAILKNSYIKVGLSEYCGLISVWAVEVDDIADEDLDLRERAERAQSIGKIKSAILAALGQSGQPTLRKVGSFSNGEGVYERVAA